MDEMKEASEKDISFIDSLRVTYVYDLLKRLTVKAVTSDVLDPLVGNGNLALTELRQQLKQVS